MKDFCKKALPDVAVVIGFLIIGVLYFFTPLSEGLVLGGHDTVAGLGQGHEQQLYREATGEYTRWTGTMFSGMPTYQIAPSYGPTTLLGKIGWVLGLFTTGPLNYIFVFLLGFYLLMRVLKQSPAISALGSALWAFSSYFFIIIAAGHIWKVNTLGFIPPTIAGVILAYRGKYLWGALVTALFTGLQVLSNHIQMTYYFLYVMAFIVIAYGIEAFRQHRALKAAAVGSITTSPSDACPVLGSSAAELSAAPTSAADACPVLGSSAAELSAVSPLRHFCRATAAIIVGGILGALINLPSLYHTYQYTHESQRGPSELTAAPSADAPTADATGGLDRAYITAWSYGVDETMTLMIPMYKGGGSTSIMDIEDPESLDGYEDYTQYVGYVYQHLANVDKQNAEKGTPTSFANHTPGLSQYWGDQPFTVGPVYVGAIVCFLFFLALFILRGPLKWALVAATVLSILFSWGHNIMPVTDFFIDHLPLYSKFRTVSSALVVAEFTMPLLAVLALAKVLKEPHIITSDPRGRRAFIISLVLSAGVCLLFALIPNIANPVSYSDTQMFAKLTETGFPHDQLTSFRSALLTMHQAILSASAWRSFWLIVVGAAAIIIYAKRPKDIPAWAVVLLIFVVSIADMWNINRNYLNDDNFQLETERTDGFQQTAADRTILEDTTLSYRVCNLTVNPFNESDNHTAYWHKSVGGYHAAKLHRYDDLINRYLNVETHRIPAAISKAYTAIYDDDRTRDSLYRIVEAEVAADPSLLGPGAEEMSQEEIEQAVMGYFERRSESTALALVDFQRVAPVLCMLNTKWFILGQRGQEIPLQNPAAQGNAWVIDSLAYVADANAEIAALSTIDLRRAAVADKRFESTLGKPYTKASAASPAGGPVLDSSAVEPSTSSAASAPVSSASEGSVLGSSAAESSPIALTSYAPNELHYTIELPEDRVVAFSEIYYPGWTATIDGAPAEVGRVNYVLRALRVPAGKHEVILTFKPASIRVTNAIAYTAIALLFVGFLFVGFLTFRRRKE